MAVVLLKVPLINFSSTTVAAFGVAALSSAFGAGCAGDTEAVPATPTTEEPPPAINHPPTLNSIPTQQVRVGHDLSFNVTGSDIDGDSFNITASSLLASGETGPLPPNATFERGLFNWRPNSSQTGSFKVRFIARDAFDNSSNSIDVTINVLHSAANSAPVISSPASGMDITITQGEHYSLPVNASDPDGDAINVFVDLPPDPDAEFNSNTRVFSWTPSRLGEFRARFYAMDDYGATSAYVTVFFHVIAPSP
ncbi:MAG: hypothetical protein HQM15_10695 [Deltaproteobacteria bacterium]|nr:hypothetical protein [Deltaproteobacteria bacterium]